jgi:multidrug/hemolysin transport system permease protein
MKIFTTLVSRSFRLYLRNKSVVFFSVLSTLILITLYFLFIGSSYENAINNSPLMKAYNLTEKDTYFMIYLQMMAGVMVLNSISTCTGLFGIFAGDFETRRIDVLTLTNASPTQVIGSYLFSGFAISYIMNIATWIITVILVGIYSGMFISAVIFFKVAIALALISFVSCSFMIFVTQLVRSVAAIGTISGIIGTFLGFLCGIYMPLSDMGKITTYVGSFLPFTHFSVWIKKMVLKGAFTRIGINSENSQSYLLENFTADNIGFVGKNLPLPLLLAGSCGVGVCFLVWAIAILNKRISVK